MRVMLINPFNVVDNRVMPFSPYEPLALEYLAAVVSSEHPIRIFDCLGEFPYKYQYMGNSMFRVGASPKQVKIVIKEYKPEIVGIHSPFVTQLPSVHQIINLIKEVNPNIITVVGGCAVSCYPEKTLRDNLNLDIVVIGEGEETFRELLDKKAQNLSTIKGIAFRNGSEIVMNERRELIKDLDSIPFPRRDLVPLDNYINVKQYNKFEAAVKLIRFGQQDVILNALKRNINNFFGKGNKWRDNIPQYKRRSCILTSRGCPFDCYFCAVQNTWGRTYRMRSAENVLDEIKLLYNKYGVRHINIADDNFNLPKERIIAICKGVIESNIKVTFRCQSGLYLTNLDESTLSLMKQAGFNELYVGVESGNIDILHNVVNKKINLEDVPNFAKLCRKVGIISGGYFIIGLPRETEQTMQDTINFAYNSGLDRVRLYTCQAFPGSRLYEDCVKNGWLSKDFDVSKSLVLRDKTFISTKDFKPQDILRIAKKGKALLRKKGILDM